MAKQSTSEKHGKVTNSELAKLVKKHPGLSTSAVIKAIRSDGYSFSGKRVRALVAGNPATQKVSAKAKGAAKPKSKSNNATKVERPAAEAPAAK